MIDNTLLIALDSFIESHSKELNGIKVIVDTDLAELFEISISHLHQKVATNLSRFPSDFLLVLSKTEQQQLKGERYAFSEEGLFMLAGLLKSKKAIKVNIGLIQLLVERQPGIGFKLAKGKRY